MEGSELNFQGEVHYLESGGDDFDTGVGQSSITDEYARLPLELLLDSP